MKTSDPPSWWYLYALALRARKYLWMPVHFDMAPCEPFYVKVYPSANDEEPYEHNS